jgi:hypothetical protein
MNVLSLAMPDSRSGKFSNAETQGTAEFADEIDLSANSAVPCELCVEREAFTQNDPARRPRAAGVSGI